MKGSRFRGDGGFTLLESIVAITLLGLVGLSFAYLYTSSHRFMIQSVNSTQSQNDAAFALEHIKRKVMVAIEVSVPPPGEAKPTLNFKWQETVPGGVTDHLSSYQLNGSNDLEYTVDGATEVIARGVRSINFDRAVAGTIAINLTVNKKASASEGDPQEMRLQTSVSPRGMFQ